MAKKRTQIQVKRNNEESQVITEVALKSGELFYNAPTDDILIGNGYNSINELPPLNVAGLVALHKGKVEGKHLFLIQSHIGDAKIFSFISYITQDYQNGDAAYIVPMLFSWDSPDTDKFLKPFKILTTHNIAPEHLAFKSGDMAMFFVHINDNYEVNAEGYLGQLFLYYIDNEGNLSLHYDVNIGPQNTSIKSNFPITNIFPIVPPNDQACDQGETVTVFPIPLASREYEFIGWYENSACLGPVYKPGDSITINSNKTLYAGWKLKSYTQLVYNPNTSAYSFLGEILSCPSPETFFKPEETPVVTDYVPTAQGGTFTGQWMLGKIPVSKGISITTDSDSLTLYATWVRHTNYTIKYICEGKEVYSQTGVGARDTITLFKAPSKTNYNFVGWYLDASRKNYAGESEGTWEVPPQSDKNAIITLYGEYDEKNKYTLKVSTNDQVNSSLTINGESKSYGTYPYHDGEKVTLIVTPLNNYKFGDWQMSGGSWDKTNNKVVCTISSNMEARAIINTPDPIVIDCTVTTSSEIPFIKLTPETHLFHTNVDSQEYTITSTDGTPIVLSNGQIRRTIKYGTDGFRIAALKEGYDRIMTIDYDATISIDGEGDLGEWLIKVPYGPAGMITDESDLDSAEYYDLAVLAGSTGKKTLLIMDNATREEIEKTFVLLPWDCTLDNHAGGKLTYEGQVVEEGILIENKNAKITLSNVEQSGRFYIVGNNAPTPPLAKLVVSEILINNSQPSEFYLSPKNDTYITTPINFKLASEQSVFDVFAVDGEVLSKLDYDIRDNTIIASVKTPYNAIKVNGRDLTIPLNYTVDFTEHQQGQWLVKVPFDDHGTMITSYSDLGHADYYKLVPLSNAETYGIKNISVDNTEVIGATLVPQIYSVSNGTRGILEYNDNIVSGQVNFTDVTKSMSLSNCQMSGKVQLSHTAPNLTHNIYTNNTNLDVLKILPTIYNIPANASSSRKFNYSVHPTLTDGMYHWQIISKADEYVRYYYTDQDPSPISVLIKSSDTWCHNHRSGSERYIEIEKNVMGTYSFTLYTSPTTQVPVIVSIYPEYVMIGGSNNSTTWGGGPKGHLECVRVDEEIGGYHYFRYKLKDMPRNFTLSVKDPTKDATITIKKQPV